MNKPLILLVTALLTAAPLAAGAEEAAAKRARTVRQPRAFVPKDFEKMFTAGPLSDPQPPSTLLPAGATSVELTVRAAAPTVCRYSVGRNLPLDEMTPFDARQPSALPKTVIRGLDPDPSKVNDVYVRCASAPDAALHLEYRSLPAAKPGFPRTANLWGSWGFVSKGMEHASRIDLWLGAHFKVGQIRQLRRLNPNCFILTSINTVENNDVPDEFFLRDTTGRKIEVWPGSYRLNLTRPEVAEYQARYAYQRMIESGLMVDGCFFDNFMMSQHWLKHDIYDRPVDLDADGDGKPDNKDAFDKAWREGVFRELREWRKLMPWALATGHSQGYPYPEIAEIFNGQGIGFRTTDVIEGKRPFYELWDYYNAWCTLTLKPAITSVESAVPDQIAYGYDYRPQQHTPPATWDFARDYYPYMRFGLAFTLMSDGYFSHELGDTAHGQDWWYDELDFKLGEPLGAAQRILTKRPPAADRELLDNGGFENELKGTWRLWCDRDRGCAAAAERDTAVKHSGTAAECINVTAAARRGGIEFTQYERTLEQGKTYDLAFWARADRPTEIAVVASKGSPNWDNYGLSQSARLGIQWQAVKLPFEANRSVQDSRIQFLFGPETGKIWIDDVSLKEHGEEVFRRDFQNGIVLLNGSRQRQTVDVGEGYAHLKGQQAPKHQYILDDGKDTAFKTSGAWRETELGTKEWHATPPYYHAWNNRCHILAGGEGEATWDLELRGPGTYTIQAWWAAAPDAGQWTRKAVYEVVAGGKVLAGKTLDQTQAGDQWHTIVEGLKLDPADKPLVRVKRADGRILVADALHVFSAERYNDGQPARQVSLEPMDGIVLRRIAALTAGEAPPPRSRAEVEAVLAKAPAPPAPGSLRPLQILLVADEKDHGPGQHDYPLWQKRWKVLLGGGAAGEPGESQVNLHGPPPADPSHAALAGAPKVNVTAVWQWPSPQQLRSADLVVMFCYRSGGGRRAWNDERIKQLGDYLSRGGGFVAIHSATYTLGDLEKPEGSKIVALTGLVFGLAIQVRHGPMTLRIAAPEHPICLGLPRVIQLVDEPYWPPAGDLGAVDVLATSDEAVAKGSQESKPQPMFWTFRHGKGRVFGCVPGHFIWTFDDPYFRILLLRGMAWAAGESPYRFDSLVLRGVPLKTETAKE